MKKIFNDEQIQFIKDHYQTMSYRDIANALGDYTERQVCGKINGMGLTKIRKFNDSYFHEIDSGEKAYWLGLLYADGWVINNCNSATYEVSIELQAGDGYLLEQFAETIGGVHPVTYKHSNTVFNGYSYDTDEAVLRIYSKRMVGDLVSNGIVERKTKSDVYPRCDHFLCDFVRGFLDGDGCIYIDHSRSKPLTMVHFTNGNIQFLNYLNDMIRSEIGITGSIYTEKEYKHRLMYFRQDDVHALLNWVYSNTSGPMLKRKYDKYIETCGLAA